MLGDFRDDTDSCEQDECPAPSSDMLHNRWRWDGTNSSAQGEWRAGDAVLSRIKPQLEDTNGAGQAQGRCSHLQEHGAVQHSTGGGA